MTYKTTQPAAPADFVAGYETVKRLESFWSANGYHGIAAIFTPCGPQFFDMATTAPLDAIVAIRNDTGASWTAIQHWVEAVSVDELH